MANIDNAADIKSNSGNPGTASDINLLIYMADMIIELEMLAVRARCDGLADLLGYVYRETERNRKLKC